MKDYLRDERERFILANAKKRDIPDEIFYRIIDAYTARILMLCGVDK